MSVLWDIVVVALERLLRPPKRPSGVDEEVEAREFELEIEMQGEERQKEDPGSYGGVTSGSGYRRNGK